MLVSRYAGYGAYDTKSVSTYNNPDNASSIESADSLNAQAAGTDAANNDSDSDVLTLRKIRSLILRVQPRIMKILM